MYLYLYKCVLYIIVLEVWRFLYNRFGGCYSAYVECIVLYDCTVYICVHHAGDHRTPSAYQCECVRLSALSFF